MRTFRIPPWFEGGEAEPVLILDNIAGLRFIDYDALGGPGSGHARIEMLVVGSTGWVPITYPRGIWADGVVLATAWERGLALIADIEAAMNA